MNVDTFRLIFNKKIGALGFADIVVEGHNPHQEGICSDSFGGLLP